MRALDETEDIRRRSSSTALFLFIPILNYIFFFWIIRASYLSMKNFYLFNRRNPSLKEGVRIFIRYIVYSTVWSGILGAILLFGFAWNPFGEMMAYYWEGVHAMIGGISLELTQSWFGKGDEQLLGQLLGQAREVGIFTAIMVFMIGSYVLFSVLGTFLGWMTNVLQEGEIV